MYSLMTEHQGLPSSTNGRSHRATAPGRCGMPPKISACEARGNPVILLSSASAFLTVAGEQPSTLAICLSPAPSCAIRRHCSSCSALSAGGLPTRFASARAWSRPSLIRSPAESTWQAPWASVDRRKNLADPLPSLVSMFSLMATMPMSPLVRSAWILTPSSSARGQTQQPRFTAVGGYDSLPFTTPVASPVGSRPPVKAVSVFSPGAGD